MLPRQGLQDVLDVPVGGADVDVEDTGNRPVRMTGNLQIQGFVPPDGYLGPLKMPASES